MHVLLSLLSILLAVIIGAMIPGPSFLTVARISMSESRQNGIAAAAGMGSGAVIFALLSILGLKAVFSAFPLIYTVLKLAGGIYLIFVCVRIWQGAKDPAVDPSVDSENQKPWCQAFISAFLIQISNPKTIIFYSSIFAALLPQGIPLLATAALPFLVFLVEVGWYSFVALVLSSTRPRSAYLHSKAWVDRAACGLMGLLGIKLIVNVVTAN